MTDIHEDEEGQYVLIGVGTHTIKRYLHEKASHRYREGVPNPQLVALALTSMPAATFPIHRELQFDDPPALHEYPLEVFRG